MRAASPGRSSGRCRGSDVRLQVSRTAIVIIEAQTAEIALCENRSENPVRYRLKQLHHMKENYLRRLIPCQCKTDTLRKLRQSTSIDKRDQWRRVDDDELVMDAQPVDHTDDLFGEHEFRNGVVIVANRSGQDRQAGTAVEQACPFQRDLACRNLHQSRTGARAG